MSENKFPWNEPQKSTQQDVQIFIETFKKYLKPNQIELLEHFRDNIYGFHLQYHNQYGPDVKISTLNHEALFVFEHFGVKGEIKVSF